VLLLQALERWRAEHGGSPPSSSAERAAFKQRLAAARRAGPEGVPLDVSAAGPLVRGPLSCRDLRTGRGRGGRAAGRPAACPTPAAAGFSAAGRVPARARQRRSAGPSRALTAARAPARPRTRRQEENVDEALKAAFHAWTQPSIREHWGAGRPHARNLPQPLSLGL
jgi:hypothetical protein